MGNVLIEGTKISSFHEKQNHLLHATDLMKGHNHFVSIPLYYEVLSRRELLAKQVAQAPSQYYSTVLQRQQQQLQQQQHDHHQQRR